jgi:hypothetical protein
MNMRGLLDDNEEVEVESLLPKSSAADVATRAAHDGGGAWITRAAVGTACVLIVCTALLVWAVTAFNAYEYRRSRGALELPDKQTKCKLAIRALGRHSVSVCVLLAA